MALILSILVNVLFLTGWILSTMPITNETTYTWNQINNDNSISSAYAFFLYLGSNKQKEEFLEDNEFLLGDRIDYCNIEILVKKPDNLDIKPETIAVVAPNGEIYRGNSKIFSQTTDENSFTAGRLSKYGDTAIVNFNESGLWSIRIEFNAEGAPIGFRYYEPDLIKFDDNSKITVFNSGINVNVYTTSEYAQLRAARAAETNARWSTISTYVLIGTAIIAVGTLVYYLWSFKRQRQISYAQQNRLEIYEPLYNEIMKINVVLNKFECPFNAQSISQVWNSLEPSQKIRVPISLENMINDFNKLGKRYYSLHYEARSMLKEKIDTVVNRYAIEGVTRGEITALSTQIEESVQRIKQQLIEQYHGDFFKGELSIGRGKIALKNLRSYLKNKNKYTEESIFNRILSQIENKQEILELRRIHADLINLTNQMEITLKEKINDILNNYESKLEDI